MEVALYNNNGKLIWKKKVESIGHYGVVRDYNLNLKGDTTIVISADTIEAIIEHERADDPLEDVVWDRW